MYHPITLSRFDLVTVTRSANFRHIYKVDDCSVDKYSGRRVYRSTNFRCTVCSKAETIPLHTVVHIYTGHAAQGKVKDKLSSILLYLR
jgi:hypothetical protein